MRRFSAVLAGLMLVAGSAGATLITNGSAVFSEPDGGIGSPGFSGVLSFEVFDSGGGASALSGGAVPTLGSDYTLVLQIAMDADVDTATQLSSSSISAFQLGTGDGIPFLSPGPTSGGAVPPAFDPFYMSFGAFANYTFLTGGGLAEGATSAAFYFTIPDVDMTATGSTQVPEGDQFTVSFTTIHANSVDIQVTVAPVVPEPSTGLLLGLGIVGLAARRHRRV